MTSRSIRISGADAYQPRAQCGRAANLASGREATRVQVGWQVDAGKVIIGIEDNGPGIASALIFSSFFYTTKSGGGGRTALARQIVEAHARP